MKTPFTRQPQKPAIGITTLEKSRGRSIEINGCTILLVTSGRAIVITNLQRHVLRRGDMVVLFHDSMFTPQKISAGFSARFISFPYDIASPVSFKTTSTVFWKFIAENPIYPLDERQYTLLDGWFQTMEWLVETALPDMMSDFMRNNLFILFMAIDNEVRRTEVATGQKDKNRGWTLLNEFSVLLSQNYETQHEVGFYADRLCITPGYLYKLTYPATGMSPKEIIDRQLESAIKYYLSDTDLSVKNIAEKLHFNDTSYMCRFFRRLNGVSPMEYRNQNTSE